MPFLVLLGYAARHLSRVDDPTVLEALAGLAIVAGLAGWMYYTMLRREERPIGAYWIAGSRASSGGD